MPRRLIYSIALTLFAATFFSGCGAGAKTWGVAFAVSGAALGADATITAVDAKNTTHRYGPAIARGVAAGALLGVGIILLVDWSKVQVPNMTEYDE